MKTILECKKLRKLYPTEGGNALALASFSASFPSTGLVAIVGKSGSGKSTLLCLLSLMEQPTSGRILYEGKDISKFKKKERMRFLRENTAFVFQHYGLFEDKTVLENVLIPLRMVGEGEKKAKETALFLLSYLRMEDKEKRIVSTLSGGEKQRVALARALAKSPKILFADEPTGALDEDNGLGVMEMISSISKTRLVIMVSHNRALVDKYADRVIELEDGYIKEDKEIRKVPEGYEEKKLGVFSSRWKWPFLLSFLKQDYKRNALTFLSGAIGLLCILLCVGYLCGNRAALQRESQRSLEYLSASLTKKEVVSAGNSPLSLVKTSKPKLEEGQEYLSSFEGVSIEEDLSYFLPSNPMYKLGEEDFSDASFLPVYDISLKEYGSSFLIQGSALEDGDFSSCYVNDLFASFHPGILGKRMEVSVHLPFEHSSVRDELDLIFSFEIKGVVREFSFLNTPKVYYSYPGLKEELSRVYLRGMSEAFQREFSALDCIETDLCNCAKDAYLVFFHDPKQMGEAYRLMASGGTLSLSSTCYVSYSSLSTLSEAFEVCLYLLFGIALMGIVTITAMSFLSLYFKRKKELALLFSMGAKKGEVMSIFALEAGLISVLYFGIAFLAFPYLEKAANFLLERNFGIAGAVALPSSIFVLGINIPLALIVGLGSIALAVLSCVFPIAFSLRKGLRKELRDE